MDRDFGCVPPPLNAQQSGIAFGLQLLDCVTSPGVVRRGIFVDDEIRSERRLAHHEIGQGIGLGNDPRVVAAQGERVAEIPGQQRETLAVAEEMLQRQKRWDNPCARQIAGHRMTVARRPGRRKRFRMDSSRFSWTVADLHRR
jgi:hypothetical protein